MIARRYLSFSLRTLFVLTTAFAVWLGVVVNRAREQREAVKAIEALGGRVTYDWQPRLGETPSRIAGLYVLPPTNEKRFGPVWLRRLIGDDFFQDVEIVQFRHDPFARGSAVSEQAIVEAIPQLKRLRKLRAITIPGKASNKAREEVKRALPACEVRFF